MKIKVHIERVVLAGIPVARADGARIQAAIETELTRLLTADGLPHHLRTGGALPRLKAPQFHFVATDGAAKIGRSIARSLNGGLGRDR
jgi:hypothetical protein